MNKNMYNRNPANVTTNDLSSFKNKSNILENWAAPAALRNVKIVVLLKYLSNFWRSL